MVCYSRGAKFEAVVHEATPKLSPLVQGGLEIPLKMTVTLAKVETLSIVEELEYTITEDYTDDSQDILAELGVETQEDDEDVEPEQEDDDDEPEQEDDDGGVELIE